MYRQLAPSESKNFTDADSDSDISDSDSDISDSDSDIIDSDSDIIDSDSDSDHFDIPIINRQLIAKGLKSDIRNLLRMARQFLEKTVPVVKKINPQGNNLELFSQVESQFARAEDKFSEMNQKELREFVHANHLKIKLSGSGRTNLAVAKDIRAALAKGAYRNRSSAYEALQEKTPKKRARKRGARDAPRSASGRRNNRAYEAHSAQEARKTISSGDWDAPRVRSSVMDGRNPRQQLQFNDHSEKRAGKLRDKQLRKAAKLRKAKAEQFKKQRLKKGVKSRKAKAVQLKKQRLKKDEAELDMWKTKLQEILLAISQNDELRSMKMKLEGIIFTFLKKCEGVQLLHGPE